MGGSAMAMLGGRPSQAPQHGDWNRQHSFLHVGPVSAPKEKIMQMRANMLANQKGLKVNGKIHDFPPAKAVEKMLRRGSQSALG